MPEGWEIPGVSLAGVGVVVVFAGLAAIVKYFVRLGREQRELKEKHTRGS